MSLTINFRFENAVRVAAGALLFLTALRSSTALAADPVSFDRQIRPIFQEHCAGCHQPAKARGGYALTTFELLVRAGDSEEIPIVAGDPEASPLFTQLVPKDGKAEMPRDKAPLHETQIALIRQWIAEGAKNDGRADERTVIDASNPPVYTRGPAVAALDSSVDGQWIAVGGYHEVLLHRTDGSGIEGRLIGLSERVQSVRFSPDGRLLAVAGGLPGRMGELQVWDVERRTLKLSVPVGYDTLHGVSWSPDGRLLAVGCPDKTLRAFDATSGEQVLLQMTHDDWILDTVFSTDGSHLVSVGRDMSAKLTEVAAQRFVDNITSITPGALRGGLQSVARHPKKDEILVGGADGRPQIYQMFRTAARKIGDNAALLRIFPEIEGRIFSVSYGPDGTRVAAGGSLDGKGGIHIYESDFDGTIPPELLKAYEKSSDGYTAEEREAIAKFTSEGIKQLHRVDVDAPVYAVRFSADGAMLYAGTGDGRILAVDTATGDVVRRIEVVPADWLAGKSEVKGDIAASEGGIRKNDSKGMSAQAQVWIAKGETVIGLDIEPARVRLTRPNDRIQVVVTARLGSGDTLDVTRMARYEAPVLEDYEIRVAADGLIEARLGDGKTDKTGETGAGTDGYNGSLRVVFGGKHLDVPIEVSWESDVLEADFIRDVNPVLAKVGCSAGTCHGANEGKNGFKLSLRGYDPVFDLRSLTDDHASRRVSLAAPDDSLMLLKATGGVPHEGGRVLVPGTLYYGIVRQWIAEGAKVNFESARVVNISIHPKNPVVQDVGSGRQIRVVARYSDGLERDVTREAFIESGNMDVAVADDRGWITAQRRGEAPVLARYEGSYAATTVTVMGDRSGFSWEEPPVHNRIDELVSAKWNRLKILPGDLCDDAEFLRRVSLDLTGLPPSAEAVREFLGNPRDSKSKRDAWIERLMNSPEFVDHWANKWADLLQVNRKHLGEEGAKLFREWIRTQVAANTPHDEFVRQLITATGSNRENPAASYWKILRNPTEAMENTTHLFLGVRFNCNQCHDHPFERWTQDQYFSLTQFFAGVKLAKDDASGDRRIGGSAVEGARPLFEIVSDSREGAVRHARTGDEVPPSFPYEAGIEDAVVDELKTRRERLADWLTSADNPYFAISHVNRLWGYMTGVGLIEPLDDIRAGNPPSNPELMDHLVREFIESGFNSRHILRQICQSRTYQLSIATHKWNEDDDANYSHAMPRRLPAEVLIDSVYRVTGTVPSFPGAPAGIRASQLVDSAVDLPSGFLANLGRPPRESACECERSNDMKLSSVMALLSGPAVSDAVSDPANALPGLVREISNDGELANELFMRVLNRPASQEERQSVERYVTSLEAEHGRLTRALEEAEGVWRDRLPELESARAQAMSAAEQALADHLVARGPIVAAERRARHERIALAEEAVTREVVAAVSRLEAWEEGLSADDLATVWEPLDMKSVAGQGSASLKQLPDGSVISVASVGELPTYTVVGETKLANITGIKLEVLPHADLPGFGPGHGGGKFLITEFQVDLASKTNAAAFERLAIVDGTTDLIAEGLDLKETWNGRGEQGRREGWGIDSGLGEPHWAAFAFEKATGGPDGSVVRVTLQHRFEPGFEIGRFRIWVTSAEKPAAKGLPSGLAQILQTPLRNRTEAQRDRLRAYHRAIDSELLRRDFDLEIAGRPLPEDGVLRQLERDLARVSRPVSTDSEVLQLREDVALSQRQLRDRRLVAAQDLTWALINTSSFLFNR